VLISYNLHLEPTEIVIKLSEETGEKLKQLTVKIQSNKIS